MQKFSIGLLTWPGIGHYKFLLKMKLTAIILSLCLIQASAATFAQRVTLKANSISYEKLFANIEQQTGYSFIYNADDIHSLPPVNVDVKDVSLKEIMDKILTNRPISYKIIGNTVVLRKTQIANDKTNQIAVNLVFIDLTVVDRENQPLPGVSIKLKNSASAWITDNKGHLKGFFDLEGTLQFSFIGYTTRDIKISTIKNPFVVVLKEDISKLDEVQVIAYGQTTKRLNTGDQTTVTAKEIQNYPVSNVLSVLQATVPGMVISQSTGQAGGTFNVNIRGQNGLTTSDDPLYIIDGVPFSGGSYASQKSNYLGSNGQAYDALNTINPLDIESINVLKDADATSIYGSRGANGVILITTKKGRAGNTKVDLNLYSGFNKALTIPQFLNTQQYLAVRHEAKKNDNAAISPFDYDINGTWDTTRYTNWPKVLLGGTGYVTNAQASISGGNNNTNYLISGNFRSTKNIQQLIGGGEQISTIHFSMNSASNDNRFNIGLTGGYTYNFNNIPSADLSGSVSIAPNAPELFTPEGNINFANDSFNNPITASKLLARTAISNLTSSLTSSYQLTKNLKIMAVVGYNKQAVNEFLANTLATMSPSTIAFGAKGSANYSIDNKSFLSVEPQLNYTKEISKGLLTVSLGGSLQKQILDATQLQATGYSSDLLINNIAAGTGISAVGQGFNGYTYKYSAYYGRANYNWADKYILNISGRYDGSSKFGENKQFHAFYAAGAAWLFSGEKFVKELVPSLSFGKLRASYGVTGNDQIGSYQYLQNFRPLTTVNPYQGLPGLIPSNLPNPNLSWETTRKANLGLELQFFSGRIGVEGNYFINTTTDVLADVPLSTTTGFNSISQNLPAKVQNKGFDLTLNTTNIQTDQFSWSTSITFTRQRNKILSFPNPNAALKQLLNQSVNTVLLNRYAGVNPQTGLYQFYDANGNIVSAPSSIGNDQVGKVDLNPDYFGSLSNTISYKGFTLNFVFRGIKQMGQSTFGQILSSGFIPGISNQNYPVAILDHWQKPGDQATFGKFASTFNATLLNAFTMNRNVDSFYGDASYIRLQNASIGYQLPKTITSKLHLRMLKVYALGENLATITNYGFSDPETQNYIKMPPLRTITFGIQASL